VNSRILIALTLLAVLPSCGKPDATGEANSIVFASRPEIWTAVERPLASALAPRFATLRGEAGFGVTHQDPAGETWQEARVAKEIVLVGAPSDPWMEPVLADQDSVPEAPSLLQVDDVWAKGQRVTLLVLPDSANTKAARDAVKELSDLIDRQFREGAIERLYVSGVNAELGRTMRSQVGFSMQVPVDFETSNEDSVYVFRSGNDSSEVVREVVVTWKSPTPPDLYAEDMLQWRSEVGRSLHGYSQSVNATNIEMTPVRLATGSGYEVQGTGRNPTSAPKQGSGPFITRAIHCPEQDRLYLLDAWVHAPQGKRYDYLIQLEIMLGTFGCVQ
jgi:hypothetical protein